ncbi:MAG: hypothetical protein RLZZ369_985, partial [Pseudomonadota bacterium]
MRSDWLLAGQMASDPLRLPSNLASPPALAMSANQPETLLTTPLHALHIELGAKMVPFGGYDMP